jgi:hypothetical protein
MFNYEIKKVAKFLYEPQGLNPCIFVAFFLIVIGLARLALDF